MVYEDYPECSGLSSQQEKCTCNNGTVVICHRCRRCMYDSSNNLIKEDTAYINKLIQNVNRVDSSQYTMNLGALTSYIGKPIDGYRNMSDRISASIVKHHVSRRRTAHRPGAASSGGSKGVDIKHGSYARYLNKIKGGEALREKTITFGVYTGTKYNIVFGCRC